jgi:sugar phosphate isomerase/epimerase
MNNNCTRRDFACLAATAATALISTRRVPLTAAEPQVGVTWPIGCFNRPWHAWTYDQALDGITAAGFGLTGLLGDHAGEQFLLSQATEQYVDTLSERIKKRELTVNIAWLRTRHDVPLRDAMEAARKQVDFARRLGSKYLLTTGVDSSEAYEHYYQVMADASAYAADQGIQIVLKPHGGCSATAEEMLRTLDRVDHTNFLIWYDAGNIVHYTDADPVADIARVAEHVVGFSAKDCARRGGDVMLQFGEGKVDFRGVFARLK